MRSAEPPATSARQLAAALLPVVASRLQSVPYVVRCCSLSSQESAPCLEQPCPAVQRMLGKTKVPVTGRECWHCSCRPPVGTYAQRHAKALARTNCGGGTWQTQHLSWQAASQICHTLLPADHRAQRGHLGGVRAAGGGAGRGTANAGACVPQRHGRTRHPRGPAALAAAAGPVGSRLPGDARLRLLQTCSCIFAALR